MAPSPVVAWSIRRRRSRRCLRRRLVELGLGLGLRALPLHLRHVVEILPRDQHKAGQNDGEDGVAIVGHRFGVSPFNSICGSRRPVPAEAGTHYLFVLTRFLDANRYPLRSKTLSSQAAGRGDAAPNGDRRAWLRNRGSALTCGRPAHNHGVVAWI